MKTVSHLRALRSAAVGALVGLSGAPLSCGNVDNTTPPATGGTAGTAGGSGTSSSGTGSGARAGSGGSGVSGAGGSGAASGSAGSTGSGGVADGGESECRGLPLDDGGSVGGSTGTCSPSVYQIKRSDIDLLSCDFAIPPPPAGQIVNPDRIQLVYTPTSTAQPEEAPKLSSSAACGQAANGGWYFDNPTSPTRISLCPCTCSRLGAGRVELRFRCRPPL